MPQDSRTVRVTFWGSTSAGKTSLMAGYYHYLHTLLEKDPNFDLVPKNRKALELIETARRMRNERKFPPATSLSKDNENITFAYCHEGTTEAAIPFEWIDYPGRWWQAAQIEDQQVIERRARVLKDLCESQVVFLLVDGYEFLKDRKDPNQQTTKRTIDEFRDQINQLKQLAHIKTQDHKFDEFVIVLTKSDLMKQTDPKYNADEFRKDLIRLAGAELTALWKEVGAEGIERRYLLLSAASASQNDSSQISDLKHVGLDAIAPIAFFAESARAQRRQAEKAKNTPNGKNMESGGEVLGGAGLGGIGAAIVGVVGAAAALPVAIAAGILMAAGVTLKVLGSKRSDSHDEEKEKEKDIADLYRQLERERAQLLLRDYYCEG